MIIEEKDFKLTPVNNSSSLYDLELLYIVNKGKSNERQEFKNEGYGITLENAIKKIVNYRINLKYPDESINLKTFLKEYKSEINEIKKLCGN